MTYETLDELWLDAVRYVLQGEELESRNGPSREVLGYSARLEDPRWNFLFNPVRKIPLFYGPAEFLWYLSGADDTVMIQAYAPQYKKFTEDGRFAHGAYGHRWLADPLFKTELLKVAAQQKVDLSVHDFFPEGAYASPISQIQAVAWLLKNNPNTRQAVVTMWNGGDLPHALALDKRDLPCTVAMIFSLRNGKLNLMVTMRSNDIWLGMPYDIFCFTSVQRLLAEILEVELGWYQHQVMSLHAYEPHYDRLKSALQAKSYHCGPLEFTKHRLRPKEIVPEALRLERFLRTKTKFYNNGFSELMGPGSMMHQYLTMLCTKWDHTQKTVAHLPDVLRKYAEVLYADH